MFLKAMLVVVAMATVGGPACAETLSIAIGQRGNWETAVSELGQRAGFFKKRGLTLELLYTEGSGETMQAVISGSVDIGIGVGTYGVLGAYSKGAPIRVIGSATTGSADLYWYVRANSPVRTLRDAAGKTIAYSTHGASTNLIVLGLLRTYAVRAEPVATGSPAATFAQVLSGEIDIGWAAPPFGLSAIERDQIRIVARGSDVVSFRNQTMRLVIANSRVLANRKDAIQRYMQSYRETLDWMYRDAAALQAYARWIKITDVTAGRVRDSFYPKDSIDPDRIEGLRQAMQDAVTLKYLRKPLSAEQLTQLVQVPSALVPPRATPAH